MFESLGKCDFLFLSYKMYVYLKIHVVLKKTPKF